MVLTQLNPYMKFCVSVYSSEYNYRTVRGDCDAQRVSQMLQEVKYPVDAVYIRNVDVECEREFETVEAALNEMHGVKYDVCIEGNVNVDLDELSESEVSTLCSAYSGYEFPGPVTISMGSGWTGSREFETTRKALEVLEPAPRIPEAPPRHLRYPHLTSAYDERY